MKLEMIDLNILNNYSNRLAYIYQDKSITYQELMDKSSEICKYLKRQGTSPVIIYGHKSIDMIILMFACLKAKRPYVPVDIFTPQKRMESIINMTQATLCVTTEKLPFSLSIECRDINHLNDLEPALEKEPSEVAYIIFTSGSTGIPKGVPILRSNLKNFIDWISNITPLKDYKENMKVLNQASFSFDLSVADIYYSLFNGHTLVAIDKKMQDDFNSMFEVIQKEQVNIIVGTPTFIKYCMLSEEFHQKNYPFLKCIYCCGEVLDVSLVKKIWTKFPDIEIINAYGPTEATSAISAIKITKEMLDNTLPVGDMNNSATNIEVIDNEIVLSGPSVFQGYLNTEEKVTLYHTGDIGEIKDGKLYCYGRKDYQVKYNGYRLELKEIENVIKQIFPDADVCTVAKKNNLGQVKFIQAFIVMKNISEEDVKEQLKKYLPSYMIPKKIIFLEQLPVNEHGKIDRGALEKL